MTVAKIAGKRKFGRRKSWGQWFVGDMFGALLCIGRGENGKISGAKNAYLVVINSASALEVVQQACGVTQSMVKIVSKIPIFEHFAQDRVYRYQHKNYIMQSGTSISSI